MNRVISKDGTTLAYDRLGSGPALILVSGAFGVRRHPTTAQLAGCCRQILPSSTTTAGAGATAKTRRRMPSSVRLRILKR